MTDVRKAAEQALEAFEMLDRRGGLGLDVHEYIRTKIEALRQALAQPDLAKVGEVGVWGEKPPVKSYCGGKPNYTTPVDAVDISQERVDETAKREHEWVGLTEKDKDELVESLPDFYSVEDVIAAVAAKLKEKNA